MATRWSDIDDDKRMELLARRYIRGESPAKLANLVGMKNPITLNRRLQELRAEIEEDIDLESWLPDVGEDEDEEGMKIEFPKEKPIPTNDELFELLKKGPVSISELSRRFDRSEQTIQELLDNMEEAGYVLERTEKKVSSDKRMPLNDFTPDETLADKQGHVIRFAVLSDTHAGSTHSQITNVRKFVDLAYEEGIRHFLHPGDLTAGQFGYRGQEWDLIPSAKVPTRRDAHLATGNQVWLANNYLPQKEGATYYILGGNHDYWHIISSGIDAVSVACKQREDFVFIGYDVADIPLTDRASVRLWHPTGGVPYALSYRLQKGMEAFAFEELIKAIEEDKDPNIRILIAGHLHVEVKYNLGPMVASVAGCFEGQTNYLKRKGLYPTIGGQIWEIHLTDAGLIQRVKYDFIPFLEIKDDWKNYPTPPEPGLGPMEPDRYDVLFKLSDEYIETFGE